MGQGFAVRLFDPMVGLSSPPGFRPVCPPDSWFLDSSTGGVNVTHQQTTTRTCAAGPTPLRIVANATWMIGATVCPSSLVMRRRFRDCQRQRPVHFGGAGRCSFRCRPAVACGHPPVAVSSLPPVQDSARVQVWRPVHGRCFVPAHGRRRFGPRATRRVGHSLGCVSSKLRPSGIGGCTIGRSSNRCRIAIVGVGSMPAQVSASPCT
jgi:hypothetical protein